MAGHVSMYVIKTLSIYSNEKSGKEIKPLTTLFYGFYCTINQIKYLFV